MCEQMAEMFERRGWTQGVDRRWRWRPQRRSKWMPVGEQEDVLICDGARVHTIRSLRFLPLCYLGPAQEELAAIEQAVGAV